MVSSLRMAVVQIAVLQTGSASRFMPPPRSAVSSPPVENFGPQHTGDPTRLDSSAESDPDLEMTGLPDNLPEFIGLSRQDTVSDDGNSGLHALLGQMNAPGQPGAALQFWRPSSESLRSFFVNKMLSAFGSNPKSLFTELKSGQAKPSRFFERLLYGAATINVSARSNSNFCKLLAITSPTGAGSRSQRHAHKVAREFAQKLGEPIRDVRLLQKMNDAGTLVEEWCNLLDAEDNGDGDTDRFESFLLRAAEAYLKNLPQDLEPDVRGPRPLEPEELRLFARAYNLNALVLSEPHLDYQIPGSAVWSSSPVNLSTLPLVPEELDPDAVQYLLQLERRQTVVVFRKPDGEYARVKLVLRSATNNLLTPRIEKLLSRKRHCPPVMPVSPPPGDFSRVEEEITQDLSSIRVLEEEDSPGALEGTYTGELSSPMEGASRDDDSDTDTEALQRQTEARLARGGIARNWEQAFLLKPPFTRWRELAADGGDAESLRLQLHWLREDREEHVAEMACQRRLLARASADERPALEATLDAAQQSVNEMDRLIIAKKRLLALRHREPATDSDDSLVLGPNPGAGSASLRESAEAAAFAAQQQRTSGEWADLIAEQEAEPLEMTVDPTHGDTGLRADIAREVVRLVGEIELDQTQDVGDAMGLAMTPEPIEPARVARVIPMPAHQKGNRAPRGPRPIDSYGASFEQENSGARASADFEHENPGARSSANFEQAFRLEPGWDRYLHHVMAEAAPDENLLPIPAMSGVLDVSLTGGSDSYANSHSSPPSEAGSDRTALSRAYTPLKWKTLVTKGLVRKGLEEAGEEDKENSPESPFDIGGDAVAPFPWAQDRFDIAVDHDEYGYVNQSRRPHDSGEIVGFSPDAGGWLNLAELGSGSETEREHEMRARRLSDAANHVERRRSNSLADVARNGMPTQRRSEAAPRDNGYQRHPRARQSIALIDDDEPSPAGHAFLRRRQGLDRQRANSAGRAQFRPPARSALNPEPHGRYPIARSPSAPSFGDRDRTLLPGQAPGARRRKSSASQQPRWK